MLQLSRLIACVLFVLVPYLTFAQPAGSKALRFNGSSNYVNCGSINLSVSEVTIQGWIKVQGFKTSFPYITSFAGTEQSGAQCAVRIGDASIPNNRVQFILYIGGSHYKLHSSQALTTNQWYHLAATYDGAQMKIYINGVLDTIRNQTGTITSNSTFELARNYANDRILNGELDEVSVFTTALSEATIRDWMCRRIDFSHPNYVSLAGYWPLDEGSGSTTADASGNGNNGTLISSPVWKNSGAPIGDESVHAYAATFSTGLAHPSGDSVHVTSTSGSFAGVHLYRIDSVPYVTSAPTGAQYVDSIRHWGVFPITDADYTVTYYYDGNATANSNECNLGMGTRLDGSVEEWALQVPDSVDYTNSVLTYAASGRQEFLLAVSNNGPHTFDFLVDEPLCHGDSNGTASVAISGGLPPYSYAWQTGSSTTSSGSVGSGTYALTVTDDHNCTSIDSVTVTEPDSLALFANSTASVCKDTNTGSATAVPIGGVAGYTYSWNDPSNSTTQTAAQLFPGTYAVTVTDGNGCEVSGTATVGSIGPDPQPDLGGDTNVCEGITFGMIADGPDAPYASYQWSTGSTSSIAVISMPGIYHVTVEHANGCSASDTVEVSYVAPIEVELGPANQAATGSLTLDAGSGFLTYLWSNLATTPSITVSQSATYWVHVKDSNLCKSSDTVAVTITPNNIGNPFNLKGLRLSPVPATDHIFIEGHSALNAATYTILDLRGRIIGSGALGEDGVLDISSLPPGHYVLKVTSESMPEQALRFVK